MPGYKARAGRQAPQRVHPQPPVPPLPEQQQVHRLPHGNSRENPYPKVPEAPRPAEQQKPFQRRFFASAAFPRIPALEENHHQLETEAPRKQQGIHDQIPLRGKAMSCVRLHPGNDGRQQKQRKQNNISVHGICLNTSSIGTDFPPGKE